MRSRSSRWRRLAVHLGPLLCLSAAACIDTEPGFDATLERASVEVRAAEGADVVGVELRVQVRVGTYALDGRNFRVTRAQINVGGAPVAEVVLNRPDGFDRTLSPGETETYTFVGESNPGAFPNARAVLCGAGTTAQVIVTWDATLETGEPESPTTMELGTFMADTMDITCP